MRSTCSGMRHCVLNGAPIFENVNLHPNGAICVYSKPQTISRYNNINLKIYQLDIFHIFSTSSSIIILLFEVV